MFNSTLINSAANNTKMAGLLDSYQIIKVNSCTKKNR